MSSSSEVFSEISSYENRLQPPIKVNVTKKNMTQSQNVRKQSGISNANVTKTLVLKPKSNTTSKISHALEVLKKFDNKYKIKTNVGLLSNSTKVVDNSNSSTNVSVKSKLSEIHDVEPASHQPMPRPRSVQVLEAVKPVPSYESIRSVGSVSQDKISKNIRQHSVLPEVVTVDESEDYESDFESSDSESLSVLSDDAKDVDSINDSQSSARPRSALAKPNLHSSETESSIHTIADQESDSIENVGLFGNMRLFTFSDQGPEAVNKIDELIVPVQLKDSSSRSRPKSSPILIEKSIDESNKFPRTLDIPILSNIIENGNTSLEKSSDFESIAESLSNLSESDDSSIPFRPDIFAVDDLDSANSYQPKEAPLILYKNESDIIQGDGAKPTKNPDVAIATGKLSIVLEAIDELNNEDSAEQSEKYILSNDRSTNDTSYELDNLSESEVKAKKKSGEKCLRLSRETESGLVSGVQSNGRTRKHTRSKTMKSTIGIDRWSENPIQGNGSRVTEIISEPMRLHLATRDVSVQTEFSVNGDMFPKNVPEEIWGRKVRPPQPVFEALNLSWDFDKEVNGGKPPIIFQHQTLTPEIIEAVANQNPGEDALDQVLKQQITLTKLFMASQYKMYRTYCMSVKQLTSQYTPVTLEETKEFIRTHKKMRTNGNNRHVL